MANYNGLVASITLNGSTVSQTMGNTGTQIAPPVAAVPAKFFSIGQFAINIAGISGQIGVQVIGAIGGATFAIAGRSNISASGGFPIPLIRYVGTSGTMETIGIPRPSMVVIQGAGVGGSTNFIGFTASVYLAAEYN